RSRCSRNTSRSWSDASAAIHPISRPSSTRTIRSFWRWLSKFARSKRALTRTFARPSSGTVRGPRRRAPMPKLMADNAVEGHLKAMIEFLQWGTWKPFWECAEVELVSFRGLRLDRDTPDRVIWQRCQAEEIVLFTANRNQEGPDSLEETLRTFN